MQIMARNSLVNFEISLVPLEGGEYKLLYNHGLIPDLKLFWLLDIFKTSKCHHTYKKNNVNLSVKDHNLEK